MPICLQAPTDPGLQSTAGTGPRSSCLCVPIVPWQHPRESGRLLRRSLGPSTRGFSSLPPWKLWPAPLRGRRTKPTSLRRVTQDKRALITGITGQDGLYLAELLLAKGYEVFGLIRGQNNPKFDLVRQTVPGVRLLTGDLTDLSSLMRALQAAQPHEVYNLGAISFVAYSWENAHVTSEVTAKGVLNILEATRLFAGPDPSAVRFYQASSSEMFGKVQQVPQREDTLLWPRSPYGVAKVFGHYMTINYRESYGMHASSGILFNHESPRRGPEFVTRKVSQAVARISLGLQRDLTMGNLNARRDWGFAGDYVEAMWRMLQQPEADDYVVSTGETRSIRELLNVAFARVGIDDWTPFVRQDPSFMRPAEVDLLIGDSSKAASKLGWKPSVGFSQLIEMMVDSDLEQQRSIHRL
jgi:GDPmannose 4,6-dehydratase